MSSIAPNKNYFRILFVEPYNRDGGPHQCLRVLVSKIDRARHSPSVVLPCNGIVAQEFVQLDVTVHFDAGVQTVPRSFSPFRQFEFAFDLRNSALRLARLIHQQKIDLVHVNSEACWVGAIAAHMAHVPTIIHLHGLSAMSPSWVGRVTTWVLNRYGQAMIATSNEVKKAYLACGASPARVYVICNGINIEKFTPENTSPTLRYELGIADEKPLLGMIANFDRRKGHHDFVASCAVVLRRVPDAQFVIVGDTQLDREYHDEIRHLITTHGLVSVMHLLGGRKDIPDILRSLDIVVQPSLTEAGPRVPLEAMAMQRPLIVTDVGGNSEEVINGQTGLVVPVGDVDSLSSAMIKLLSDKPLAQQLGKLGRQRVLEKFTDDIYVSQVEQLYDRILTDSNWHVQ